MSFRIGQGIDVHAFGPGTQVVLGGVTIPHEKGLVAHSDGDVLLHALADALLGALALGDIGKHFPDTDARYAGADSRALLRHVVALIHTHGYRLINADATLIAQAPRMAPHIDAMRENIAADCQTPITAISVKATTSEKLGFTGRKEGIAAQAVVLLEQRSVPGVTS
ncbi:2-C-methyl-D-erythritol 2,4-cyclodiphosphate synthase [Microbulbifer salipaludis]|uniref:2-C-methyl-D-erythritol 2,4-cyclodiphosphate synthase n=1 Tax=Microbulbifer salipaludis TaxID=187980 RepID=A0ABS3EA27_9GAMM|nr:2-C-methyl-D-erythritol 2,4-cyclodiphosphate synthase [Microbulbifer salipaludis]MBN8432043.1 2-C-methyl-D-erythritol 2,4-cyclodiphosphate synthase [Microbulbifer salipaludis]